MFALRHQKWPR